MARTTQAEMDPPFNLSAQHGTHLGICLSYPTILTYN
jgi:hypothetical protein